MQSWESIERTTMFVCWSSLYEKCQQHTNKTRDEMHQFYNTDCTGAWQSPSTSAFSALSTQYTFFCRNCALPGSCLLQLWTSCRKKTQHIMSWCQWHTFKYNSPETFPLFTLMWGNCIVLQIFNPISLTLAKVIIVIRAVVWGSDRRLGLDSNSWAGDNRGCGVGHVHGT